MSHASFRLIRGAMGFTLQQTLLQVLVANLTAAGGAFLPGHVQDRIAHIRAVARTLMGRIATILPAWGAREPALLRVAANGAGVCLGASQSADRARVAALAPPSRPAEFSGPWGLAVTLASIAGPLINGLAGWLTGGDHRLPRRAGWRNLAAGLDAG